MSHVQTIFLTIKQFWRSKILEESFKIAVVISQSETVSQEADSATTRVSTNDEKGKNSILFNYQSPVQTNLIKSTSTSTERLR